MSTHVLAATWLTAAYRDRPLVTFKRADMPAARLAAMRIVPTGVAAAPTQDVLGSPSRGLPSV